MKLLAIDQFYGLDLQPHATVKPGVLVAGDNIEISPAGEPRRRPAFRDYATLDATSKGLYVVGERMHTAVPYVSTLPDVAGITYDHLAGGGSLDRVVAAEADTSGNAYLATFNGTGYEHHYVNVAPGTDTLQSLPFTPGPGLVAAESRLWSLDSTEGFLHGSGISDYKQWNTADPTNPAGLFRVSQFVQGGMGAINMGIWNGRLAIFYNDAVQLWRVNADLNLVSLEQLARGPGLRWADSLAQVGPDLIYAGFQGFRSLSNSLQTLEARESDFGAKLDPLTNGWPGDDEVIGLYSTRRSQYLAARGSTIYVLLVNRERRRADWTTWTVPGGLTITDMVELNGELFFRAGNRVYQVAEGIDQDLIDGTLYDVPVRLETPDHTKGPHRKMIQRVYGLATEDTQLQLRIDGRNGRMQTLPGRYPAAGSVFATGMGRSFGFSIRDFVASADWRLSALWIEGSNLGN